MLSISDLGCAAELVIAESTLVKMITTIIWRMTDLLTCAVARNPGYPGKYSTAGDCEWKINKLRDDICQIRLDFETMEIADPNGGIESNKLR